MKNTLWIVARDIPLMGRLCESRLCVSKCHGTNSQPAPAVLAGWQVPQYNSPVLNHVCVSLPGYCLNSSTHLPWCWNCHTANALLPLSSRNQWEISSYPICSLICLSYFDLFPHCLLTFWASLGKGVSVARFFSPCLLTLWSRMALVPLHQSKAIAALFIPSQNRTRTVWTNPGLKQLLWTLKHHFDHRQLFEGEVYHAEVLASTFFFS